MEITDVLRLEFLPEWAHEEKAKQLLAATRAARGSIGLLFFHRDAGSDAAAAVRNYVSPFLEGLREGDNLEPERVVAVIPVREMEAWVMADGDALRAAFGSTLSDRDLRVPDNPRAVENIADPKAAFNEAFITAVGSHGKKKATTYLDPIAERTSVERLRRVPAFAAFEADVEQALERLNYFR